MRIHTRIHAFSGQRTIFGARINHTTHQRQRRRRVANAGVLLTEVGVGLRGGLAKDGGLLGWLMVRVHLLMSLRGI